MTQPLALYGGTFNPIHNGHIAMASQLAEQTHLSQIELLPCFQPVHKAHTHVRAEHRMKMLSLVCEQHPLFKVNKYEIELARSNYTLDTLKHFRLNMPNRPLLFIVGFDSLKNLESWYAYEHILDYAHLLVMPRPGNCQQLSPTITKLIEHAKCDNWQILHQELAGKIFLAKGQPMDIASSQVREKLQNNKNVRNLLPPAVYDYIQKHKLYQEL